MSLARNKIVVAVVLVGVALTAVWLLLRPRGADRGVAPTAASRTERVQRFARPWEFGDEGKPIGNIEGIVEDASGKPIAAADVFLTRARPIELPATELPRPMRAAP